MTKSLYALLAGEWICQKVSEGLCKIDADSWTNSNGSGELPTATFQITDFSASQASIRSRCRLLDDLVGAGGLSLRQQLQH
jgi:hypothetical protein